MEDSLREIALQEYRNREALKLNTRFQATCRLLDSVLHYQGPVERVDYPREYGGIEAFCKIQDSLIFTARNQFGSGGNAPALRLLKLCSKCEKPEIEVHFDITDLASLGSAIKQLDREDVCYRCKNLPDEYRHLGSLIDAFETYLTRFLTDRGVLEEIDKDYNE
jgi:hypothetical protein